MGPGDGSLDRSDRPGPCLGRSREPAPTFPGLDGIRAIAVLSVIVFHLNFGWASGGLLGVQVFFVLSGYLITDLLVAEYRRQRGIALAQFWIRRARRLLPALFVVLSSPWDGPRCSTGANWPPCGATCPRESSTSATGGSSSTTSPTSPSSGHLRHLGHLWSLSIEEQFYLIWPLLVLAAMKYLHNRRTMIILTLAVAAASAVEMGILFVPDGDPTRVYDGTDTRAFALLIGAALAMALPRNQTFTPVTVNARRLLDAVGGISLLGIFLMFWLPASTTRSSTRAACSCWPCSRPC